MIGVRRNISANDTNALGINVKGWFLSSIRPLPTAFPDPTAVMCYGSSAALLNQSQDFHRILLPKRPLPTQ
jgi:hypothetical protein